MRGWGSPADGASAGSGRVETRVFSETRSVSQHWGSLFLLPFCSQPSGGAFITYIRGNEPASDNSLGIPTMS